MYNPPPARRNQHQPNITTLYTLPDTLSGLILAPHTPDSPPATVPSSNHYAESI